MPKLRQTCTRCSMRRQKCDRKEPCTRCVRHNEADSCTRIWPNGYDPRIHRTYPKSKSAVPTSSPPPQEPSNAKILSHNGDGTRDRVLSSLSHISASSAPPAYSPSAPSTATPNGAVRSIEEVYSRNVSYSTSQSDISFLQSLLPSSRQILQLVEYHELYLRWFHDCIHGPTFSGEVNAALQNSEGIQIKNLDLRWCALLFAVMASSLACTNDSFRTVWGFSKEQKSTLSKKWYDATLSCLHLGQYTSKLHIHSIQAIMVLSMASNLLGFSNEQFIIYGAIFRIAVGLGLHRLTEKPELDDVDALHETGSQSQLDLLATNETNRRIWSRICTQDWLSIPATEMYFIHKNHFTTPRPRRINDSTMRLAPNHVPLSTDFVNYMHDVSSLMADFHDAITPLSDVAERYEVVLKYDMRMRSMGVATTLPASFFTEEPEPFKPPWVWWARSAANILHAHKLIMIHRSFFIKSFNDPRYAYTRWASVTASRTIVKEMTASTTDSERPALWSCQAHLVGAGRTLCLDILNRAETEPEFVEHRKLVEDTISTLGYFDDSTLASRGRQLLSSFLSQGKIGQRTQSDKDDNEESPDADPVAWPLENRQIIDAMLPRKSSRGDHGNTPIASMQMSGQRQQRSNFPTTPAFENGLFGVSMPQSSQFDMMTTAGELSGPDGFVLPDASWVELLSESFPFSWGGINGTFT